MRKNGKRILSFILLAVMVFALLPVFGMPMVVKADEVPQEHCQHDEQDSGVNSKYHVGWAKISTSEQLLKLGEEGGSGYLVNNIDISETFKIESGKTVNLCLNGYSITQTSRHDYTITVEGTLNLYDKENNFGKITHEAGKKGGGVENLHGTFTMNGGTIIGNSRGVINIGTFTMNGGTIWGNTADIHGGGVYNAGTFTMNGGTISGNEAKVSGGGVYNDGTFTMNGGTIEGNIVFSYEDEYLFSGGGIFNNVSGTYIMNGGTISGNAAKEDGGGVYNLGTFSMTGGTISGNVAKDDGGGVDNLGTFSMTGGAIKGKNYARDGGGVINYGIFEINGGTISGNEATEDGGGVFNSGDATFTMNEGTISGNEAALYGGGVYNFNIFTMTGGTIEGNKAIKGGGVLNEITFTMNGGTIKENTANKGTGVYVFNSNSFTKEGGDIDGSIEGENGTACAVTFNACNETNDSIIQYVNPNEDTKLAPNKFSKEGKKFGCWRDESGNKTYEDNATIKINNNIILNAIWIESAKVKFAVNNGSWSEGSTVKEVEYSRYDYEDKALVLDAADIPTPGNPNKGYKAGSWDTEPETDKALTDNKTYTYTYTFAPIEYTIKYDANGGTGTMNNQSRTYNVNASLTANAFTFEGRTFDGWNTAADGSGTPFSNGEVTGNLSETDQETITLYAQWTTDTFTISWKNYDGTVLETDKNVAYGSTPSYDGDTPVRAKEGNKEYTFTGWTPEVDTVKGAATYTATYSEKIVEPDDSQDPTEPTDPTEPQDPEEPEEEIPAKDWLDDLRLQLQISSELTGPQTVKYSGDFALSYDIMLYLVEHPDITLIYTVTYEGEDYTITIPGGKAIADPNIPWYGPLWLLANYGGDNVPEVLAGSGKYTVVAGDTLSAIAEKFGTTVDYLAQKNGIKNPDYIIVGQVIVY